MLEGVVGMTESAQKEERALLKSLCARCDFIMTAPQERRGERIPCGRCGSEVLMISAEDAARELAAEQARERLEQRRRRPEGLEEVPAVRRLRDLSDLLLLFSYLQGLLALGAGLTPVILGGWPLTWQVLCLVLGGLVGAVLFITFKFLSELVQALSERTIGQLAINEQLREILLILRDREHL